MASLHVSWPALRERLISIDETRSTNPPDTLTAAALIYIALPSLIFLGGWLKLPYAIIAVMLVTASLWQFLRSGQLRWRQPYTKGALLLIVAMALAWCSLGGAGHFFYANSDWQVRDTVLADLVMTPWPPSYGLVNGEHLILRSAIGFFLPAAVIGKLVGMGAVNIALYLWTTLGTVLFLLLLPLPNRAGWQLWLMIFIVIFFSGMDFLGIVLLTGDTPIFPLRLEWWVPFSYTSFAGQLFWAPNHTLALWLVTAMFYRHWGHATFPALINILLPLLLIWTPFAVAGILPFIAIALLRWFSLGKSVKEWDLGIVQIVASVLLTLFMVRLMTLGIGPIPSGSSAETLPPSAKNELFLHYLIFALMEFAILTLLLAKETRRSWGLFWLSATILCLLPLYHFGPSNDTMLRLSVPCLLILLIQVLDRADSWFYSPKFSSVPIRAWVIGIVLLVGACTPFNEMWRAATFRRFPPNYGVSLLEVQDGRFVAHYFGKLDRAEIKALLRTPSLVPTGEERLKQLTGVPYLAHAAKPVKVSE